MSSVITYLTTVRFGFGALAGLGEDLAELGVRSPLVVTDHGVAHHLGGGDVRRFHQHP